MRYRPYVNVRMAEMRDECMLTSSLKALPTRKIEADENPNRRWNKIDANPVATVEISAKSHSCVCVRIDCEVHLRTVARCFAFDWMCVCVCARGCGWAECIQFHSFSAHSRCGGAAVRRRKSERNGWCAMQPCAAAFVEVSCLESVFMFEIRGTSASKNGL